MEYILNDIIFFYYYHNWYATHIVSLLGLSICPHRLFGSSWVKRWDFNF